MIKSAHRALALAVAAAVLAGCGASGAVPGPNAVSGASTSSVLQSPSFMAPNAILGFKIKKVTPIQAEQYQTIVIKGTGFGKMKPFAGDSCCMQFVVTNPACLYYYPYNDTWQAGYEGSGNDVGLVVTHWTNTKIIVTGFDGLYGSYCWYLVSGQPITINVWNAKTQKGPVSWTGTVQ